MFHYPSRSITNTGPLDYTIVSRISTNVYPIPINAPIMLGLTKIKEQADAKVKGIEMSQKLQEALRSWRTVTQPDKLFVTSSSMSSTFKAVNKLPDSKIKGIWSDATQWLQSHAQTIGTKL